MRSKMQSIRFSEEELFCLENIAKEGTRNCQLFS